MAGILTLSEFKLNLCDRFKDPEIVKSENDI